MAAFIAADLLACGYGRVFFMVLASWRTDIGHENVAHSNCKPLRDNFAFAPSPVATAHDNIIFWPGVGRPHFIILSPSHQPCFYHLVVFTPVRQHIMGADQPGQTISARPTCQNIFGQHRFNRLLSKRPRAKIKQGTWRRKSGVYKGVNEDFEPPCNAVMSSAASFERSLLACSAR